MKAIARAALSSKWVTPIWSWSTRGCVSIFTFHRFSPSANERFCTATDLLDRILSRLQADGYRFVGLEELLRRLHNGPIWSAREVAFTVDDGYEDFLAAAEVFLDHRCPATVFLTTGFIDGEHWLWWDQIDYVCRRAAPGRYRPIADGPEVSLTDESELERVAVGRRVASACTRLPEESKLRFIRTLAENTGIELPPRPPSRYAPLSWDQIRGLEESGIRFGPHTVTHPVLARVDDAQAAWEIRESWRRVRDQLRNPVPILAYPNGEPCDYGEREARIAAASGLLGAVTTTPDCAEIPVHGSPEAAFRLPRFPEPPDPDGASLAASGFYRLRRRLRRGSKRLQ